MTLQLPRGKAWEKATFLANWKPIQIPYSILKATIPVITGTDWSYTTTEDAQSGQLRPGYVDRTIGSSIPASIFVDAAMTASGTLIYMSVNLSAGNPSIFLDYGAPFGTLTQNAKNPSGNDPVDYHGYLFVDIINSASQVGMILFWQSAGSVSSYRANGTDLLTSTGFGETIALTNNGTWTCARTGNATPAYSATAGRIYLGIASSTLSTIYRYFEANAFSTPTGLSVSAVPCYALGWKDPNLDEHYAFFWGTGPNLSITRYRHATSTSTGYDIFGPVTTPSRWLCRCGLFRVGNGVVGFYPTTTGIVRVTFDVTGTGTSATPSNFKVEFITVPTPMVDVRQVSYGFFARFGVPHYYSKDGRSWQQTVNGTLCVEAGGITVEGNGFTSVRNHPGVYKGAVKYGTSKF